jgi:hypothetical protein
MRWDKEMNINVIRAYFRATKCDSQTSGYRTLFYNEWKNIYPNSTVTEQRICDQYRVINRNKLLTATEIDKIKNDIRLEIEDPISDTSANNSLQLETSDTTIIYAENETLGSITEKEIEIPQILKDEFRRSYLDFEGSDPTFRPRLPKIQYNKKSKQTIDYMNKFLDKEYAKYDSLEHIHLTVYAAATAVCRILNIKFQNPFNDKPYTPKDPKWKTRIESKISKLRSDLTKLLNNKNNPHRKYSYLLNKYKLDKTSKTYDTDYSMLIDYLKQKIMASGKRLKRYNKSLKRKQDNRIFNNNQKHFYQSLTKEAIVNPKPPNKTELIKFWENLWSKPITHKSNTSWLKDEIQINNSLVQMQPTIVFIDDLKVTLRKLQNWKAPGPDMIQNYWWKYLTAIHPHLTLHINHLMENPESMPKFLLQGITYLKYKTEKTDDPKNYRPITCLPTLYKIISSIISNKVDKYLTQNKIMTEEQKGCRKNSQGCKEQLIIDIITTKQAHKKNRNLSIAWIDYKKAYDSIPHSWLIEVLKIYKIDNILIKFL